MSNRKNAWLMIFNIEFEMNISRDLGVLLEFNIEEVWDALEGPYSFRSFLIAV
jgi:hypothetical protein